MNISRVFRHDAFVLSALSAAFMTLLALVLVDQPTSFDRSLGSAVQSIPWGSWAFIPRLGSDIGGGLYGFYVVPAGLAVVLAWRREWRLLGLLVAVFALHYLMIMPKQFVTAYRPSPAFGVEGAGGLESFPSGHVEWATSFYGLLAYIVATRFPRLRWPIIGLYAVVVAGTMLGRIELGRHWPVDTLAGLIVGLVAVRLLVLADRRFGRPALAPAT